ncbi:hypothetical protein [Taibaiella koreensis]|uniref:hypothetical protein n=1 Tax=Taibaiella koreensis TaxID=1268548 RepID=UPI000E59FFBC|nr:hypothetical protein [Taibaiella koreensis]
MKLQDRRVERILKEKGLQDAEVFHGPKKVLWLFLALVIVGGAGIIIPFFAWAGWYVIPFPLLYLAAGFVISGRYFNSIAVTDKELIIINPNFLFRKYTAFPLDEIRLVVMGSRPDRVATFFCLLACNYIEVGTDSDIRLFFCMGLDEHDGYGDEGFTEKTLEDLAYVLQRKNITVQTAFEAD